MNWFFVWLLFAALAIFGESEYRKVGIFMEIGISIGAFFTSL